MTLDDRAHGGEQVEIDEAHVLVSSPGCHAAAHKTVSAADSGQSHVILEFFSGVGGMRYAAECWADLAGNADAATPVVRVAASFEISEVCNRIYDHNFGDKPKTKSIEHLDAAYLDRFQADTWLMSPPCQPYTSMGKQRDAQDPRASALLHLCDVIPKLTMPPTYILLENVNHFQRSQSHGLWMEALTSAGFTCHEFLLSPAQIGIPNERLRYYCLARRHGTGEVWDPSLCGRILNHVPGDESVRPGVHDGFDGQGLQGDEKVNAEGEEGVEGTEAEGTEAEGSRSGRGKEDPVPDQQGGRRGGHGLIYVDLNATRSALYSHCRPIQDFLESGWDRLGGGSGGGADAGGELMGAEALERYLIPDAELMKYKGYVFDIVTPDSKRCSCFTKAYSKYIRGTGSLLSTNFYDDDGKCFFDTADPWSVQVSSCSVPLSVYVRLQVSCMRVRARAFVIVISLSWPSA